MNISEPEENYQLGWIKIFRSLENHWIWVNEKYFKCWIWFLFRANHTTNKILFAGKLIELNRGEFITSINNISSASNLSIQEVRHFLLLLEKDKMIFKNSNTRATKITICNYDSYQGVQHTNNTPTTNRQQTDNKQTTTDKNVKNIKNEKEVLFSKFYDSQIEKSGNDEKYIHFVKFLFGQNELSEKLNGVLSIEKQLTFEQFNKLIHLCQINKVKLLDTVLKMDNDKKYYKDKKNLYLTLNNWINQRFTNK